MARRSSGPVEFRLDDRSLRDISALAKDLRGTDKVLLKEMRSRLKKAAQPVLRDAKREAATFSTRIPASLGISAQFPARGIRLRVRANAKKAPHARPIENKGQPGTFRHPVFGSDTWVTQPARPFFFKAVRGNERAIEQEVAAIADDIARRAGFR